MLKVLKAGFYLTIQDKGRVGFAAQGVPVSGAMDAYAADLANAVLNNSFEAAVLEITFGACKFEFLEPTLITITGGDFSPKINNNPIQLNKKVLVHKGDILTFGKVNYGVRCYLAVKGGFQSEIKLKSRSFYPDITKDFILRKNDEIFYKPYDKDINTTQSSIKINKSHFKSQLITCFQGPEFDMLNEQQQKRIASHKFSISKEHSRMGYKLHEEIANNLPQILTAAVLPGTVQLTPSGKLIVLMRDCQVTGGYPRILQLTEASINKLAQKTMHNFLQFSIIGI
ncbi:biotin-dependent carboxyltransferase family protein [Polaribacter sp.]|uniref:5-oxoprolinase subunit C family protein n=1 Tax=Polaribacter sp. TaxID=1920175 RepID=UPI003F6BE366